MPEFTGPHDYFNLDYVREWTEAANNKRPFRLQFFAAFVAEVRNLAHPKVLDLGSGPGFLADNILRECNVDSYHLFDFSPHMLEISKERLRSFEDRTHFYEGSFLDQEWWRELPAAFDAIVSLQAIHELRDATCIPGLYRELRSLLSRSGMLLVADEINDDRKHENHLLTIEEHAAAFQKAGFADYRQVYAAGDLVLFAAGNERKAVSS